MIEIIFNKDKNKEDAIAEIESELKLTLKAKKADDTVNGYVVCIEQGTYILYQVYLYEADRNPTYQEYTYKGAVHNKGTKIKVKKKDPDKDGLDKLKAKDK